MMEMREIHDLYEARKKRLSPMRQAALQVQRAYYNEIVLPLPELDRAEKPLVANLLLSGGEQRALRVSSTMPSVYVPSTNPGQKLADKIARQRKQVLDGWGDSTNMAILLRKRSRYMVFYASTPVVMRPNFRKELPDWHVMNPLSTFAPEMDVGQMVPPDVIFTYEKSLEWVRGNYPDQFKVLNKHPDPGMSYVILEYIDHDEYVTGVIGEAWKPAENNAYNHSSPTVGTPSGEIVELDRVPNRLGRTPAVICGRVGLERAQGEFDGAIGLYQAQAKLQALMVHGVQRSIYPEEWLVDNPQDPDGARIVTHADPMHGITGRVTGGTLQTIHPIPEVLASNVGDQLERAFRIQTGVPAELGGESTSNVRTGKRGDAILSAVLDFPIQEEQQLLEVALREEYLLAIEIDKAYFPQSKSVYLSASAGTIEYQARDFWDTLANLWVRYAHAGVDAQGIPVEIGQRVGMGTMSKRTAMEIDPLIDDPQGEFDRITVETARTALLQSISAMAQDPEMAPIVAQILMEMRSSETEIEDAVLKIHAQMQQQQAQQQAQQQPGPQGPPGAPAPPGQQPGMAQPGQAIQAPPPSAQALTALLSGLHRQQTTGQTPPGASLVGAAAGQGG